MELSAGSKSIVEGSIGYEILRQFVITFDYSHRDIWLERSAAFGTKTVQWKTGFQAVKAEFGLANECGSLDRQPP
jgi:hypothetical protein